MTKIPETKLSNALKFVVSIWTFHTSQFPHHISSNCFPITVFKRACTARLVARQQNKTKGNPTHVHKFDLKIDDIRQFLNQT